jgi:hypothetical protein
LLGGRPPVFYGDDVDPRLRTAVHASLQWYDDVFAVHGVPTSHADGLWCARGEPPRWHSAAKTVEPTVGAQRVVRAVEPFEHCSVADSFGTLDLSDAGFALLFEATWVHHEPLARPPGEMPEDWSVVKHADELDRWNALHDTAGVLLPEMLGHRRFTFLAHDADDGLTGGAVLHDCRGDAVGLSNSWTLPGTSLDVAALVACASMIHPGRGIVDYAWGDELDALVDGGFSGLGPQVVWVR